MQIQNFNFSTSSNELMSVAMISHDRENKPYIRMNAIPHTGLRNVKVLWRTDRPKTICPPSGGITIVWTEQFLKVYYAFLLKLMLGPLHVVIKEDCLIKISRQEIQTMQSQAAIYHIQSNIFNFLTQLVKVYLWTLLCLQVC